MQKDLTANTKSMKNTCAHCQKELHGRSDQKFCNDNCRNTFNRHKRAADKIIEHKNMPEILRIIKRNYELLKSTNRHPMEENEGVFMPIGEFNNLGIDTRFYTSRVTDKDGEIWYCLFERGYRTDEKYAYLQDFPGQAKI